MVRSWRGPSQQHLHLDGPMQWDEMELHLALDELVKAESCPSPGPAPSAVPAAHPVLGSGGAPNALDPGPKLQHAAPGYPPPTPGLSSATWDEQSADNCTADLGACSFYYQRNHICPAHLKAGAYAVRGVSTRFCQRCGVGHPVEDFSGAKRSCKKALDRHNQRRREKQGGSEGGQTGEDTGGPSQSRATPHASHANLAACSAMHPAPPACQPDAGADWEASSRFGGGAYAAAQPWNLPPDLLPLLGMSPPEGAVYGGAGPGAAAPAQGTSAGEVAHLQHWLAAGQGWGEFPQQAAQQAWQQPQDASGESGAFMHSAAPPPAPSSLYAALGEPSLSVGSVAMPTLDPGMLSMAPMPPEQLSWLSSQL
ncbi:Squamosa promoter-binding-like protein 16 [Auxenochlorella protothecoides]|uniref:Squamosa promoter-binding-like protein 16 n=1 Tax=Auxenochlorella protothecoides TaxID=3075 RepID=A0A087SJN4_AUXPR|nr:Squamosa promoter-binding-like protein 16 [Auxenochlorella protothecoides]KFM25938.1 Squamosa promoter-binding-like protein 16 [Auxenochlorella protothecoides]